ncbi:tail fiber protein [Pseudoalteromonas sp. KAN5]|uniref:phage tail protein n=1 Tax=Pseudoalteromonas sp. KAN5 TaxID=2916633 RepID=UPI001FCAE1CF|nr:tail fiber protein [Pseudoalteromonas sp. KAN5]BDF93672.1 microcystin dependent MdpB family protein [Pseudoalteromonas sp. KAN5]
MAEPFLGEVKMFGANFAPRNWAFCNGQLVAIAQQDALFSLLGTTYGGDGRTSFAYPDMRGRLPVKYGQGNGLSRYRLGQKNGTENVTLTLMNVPSHSHQLLSSTEPGTTQSPENNVFAPSPSDENIYYSGNPTQPPQMLAEQTVQVSGHSAAHSNMMPYTCINFIISLAGIYPSRS